MAGDGSRERLRARLRDGERLLGTFVKSRDPLISETLATAGTPLGIFCATADEARRWTARGLTLLAISTDLGMLRGAAVSALGQLRAPR